MKIAFFLFAVALSLWCYVVADAIAETNNQDETAEVSMATGFKIVEVTQTTASVWTRLTKAAERNTTGPDFERKADAIPDGKTLEEMFGSAVGVPGEVRLVYGEAGTEKRNIVDWTSVANQADYTKLFHLKGLKPDCIYTVQVDGRPVNSKSATVSLTGQFKTAPPADSSKPVSFTVVTGQDDDRRDDDENGHKIYAEMLKLKPDFFAHTGDVVYYDKATPWAKDAELARYKWQATYSLPFQRDFHRNVSSYFMRDDHDITRNDSWPGIDYGKLTWKEGLKIFEEQTGLPGETPYRTVRWGRDLQVWMMEGRKFRSKNNLPDGPEKTIWGSEQKKWFFETVKESDATFRILISPTPVVGPDRKNKNDNHANEGFTHEGDEIREFISQQRNMYIVCGDRHWQYVSVDEKTGVREYSCGPTSNEHAGGWSEDFRSPMHKYLKVKGGFLRVNVERADGTPRIVFQHYSVDGEIYNEDIRSLQNHTENDK